MAGDRVLRVIGVPSSAAAYCVGVERAPGALREAGLIRELRGRGSDVRDGGDLTTRWWRPDREAPLAQNWRDELAAQQELLDVLAPSLQSGERALVLGGTCVVALGVCASMRRAFATARMLYVDRHLDLNTPDTTSDGSLSWMGMAHALAAPSALPELAALGGEPPLLRADVLSYLGVDLVQTTPGERERVDAGRIPVTSQAAMVADPAGAAREAVSALAEGPFAVHVDVDLLDFLDAPLSENVDGRNSGPTIDQLGEALTEVWSRPDCRVMSIGQLDPNHAASSPADLDRFVAMLAGVLGRG